MWRVNSPAGLTFSEVVDITLLYLSGLVNLNEGNVIYSWGSWAQAYGRQRATLLVPLPKENRLLPRVWMRSFVPIVQTARIECSKIGELKDRQNMETTAGEYSIPLKEPLG